MSKSAIDRSMDGLREALFDALDQLRAGTIDHIQARAISGVAMTIIKSAEVQIEYEQARLESKVPKNLPAMPLTPLLPKKTYGSTA